MFGERGIRTLGTKKLVQRISNQSLSTTQPSLLFFEFYHCGANLSQRQTNPSLRSLRGARDGSVSLREANNSAPGGKPLGRNSQTPPLRSRSYAKYPYLPFARSAERAMRGVCSATGLGTLRPSREGLLPHLETHPSHRFASEGSGARDGSGVTTCFVVEQKWNPHKVEASGSSSLRSLRGASDAREMQSLNSQRKKNHPGTKLKFPARLPTSLSTSSEFHSQVRDGLAWFH